MREDLIIYPYTHQSEITSTTIYQVYEVCFTDGRDMLYNPTTDTNFTITVTNTTTTATYNQNNDTDVQSILELHGVLSDEILFKVHMNLKLL